MISSEILELLGSEADSLLQVPKVSPPLPRQELK